MAPRARLGGTGVAGDLVEAMHRWGIDAPSDFLSRQIGLKTIVDTPTIEIAKSNAKDAGYPDQRKLFRQWLELMLTSEVGRVELRRCLSNLDVDAFAATIDGIGIRAVIAKPA